MQEPVFNEFSFVVPISKGLGNALDEVFLGGTAVVDSIEKTFFFRKGQIEHDFSEVVHVYGWH